MNNLNKELKRFVIIILLMNQSSIFLFAQEGNKGIEKIDINNNNNNSKLHSVSSESVKSYIHNYSNNETKMVRKVDVKSTKAENKIDQNVMETTGTKKNRTSVAVYNPLSNFNQNTASQDVLKKMQLNKEENKDLFNEICLVYIFETGIDSDKTNYNNLLSMWQKQKAFIALNRMEHNKFKLFLNAQFDTEQSEDIMAQNKLNVIFKEEFYSIYSIEK
jgi:hypothetical protein